MSKQTCDINIKGMHCRSCELLIEDELSQVRGVKKVVANEKKGVATVTYKGQLDHEAVAAAVARAGYEVADENESANENSRSLININQSRLKDLGVALGLVGVLVLAANKLDLSSLGVGANGQSTALSVVFLVGLTAGVSTCMALVGGLVLATGAKFAQNHPNASALSKFTRQLLFNAGRVGGFFALGGLLGLAGSALQLSTSLIGVLTVAVGMVMLVLGGQLLNVFPWLDKVKFTLPKALARSVGISAHSSSDSPIQTVVLGALTFFVPCGFTQAMQLLAVSSGSFTQGSLIMGTFALGTMPGLLGIGSLASFFRGQAARYFFSFAGLVVILMSIFNITNGLNLLGIQVPEVWAIGKSTSKPVITDPNVTIQNGVQIVKMTQDRSGYNPNTFTIQKGMKVRWIINSTDPYSCASSILLSKYGIRQNLSSGENVIEFTPTESGVVKFSCSMGMYTGKFNVIDPANPDKVSIVPANETSAQPQGTCSMGGCGCGNIAN